MPKITLYPVGTADTSQMDLADGQKILVDYCHRRASEDKDDPRIDLAEALRADLKRAKREDYDVVAFTHLDKDHCDGASDFFWLDYAKQYQGQDRIKIKTLWVPAAAILDDEPTSSSWPLRQEARHRLIKGEGIRVFSRPARLKAFLESKGLTLESRAHLITDAGSLVPGYSKNGNEGVEFFIHTPYAERVGNVVIDKNGACLCFQATFNVQGTDTRAFFTADITHEDWTDIVNITEYHKRPERLTWDIMSVPHHCSYLSIGPDKGKDMTQPVPAVDKIYRQYGQQGAFILSSSDPIPDPDTEEDKNPLPPHRQAANYYKDVASAHKGKFLVTMEEPNVWTPKPIVIEITWQGFKRVLAASGSAAAAAATPPRAG